MSPLLQSLQDAFDALPAGGDDHAARRAALAAAVRDGLPTARDERWKYTSLRAFERRRFALPSSGAGGSARIDAALLADIPAPRLVFVNGAVDPLLSQVDGLPDGITLRSLAEETDTASPTAGVRIALGHAARESAFERLNAALARDGAQLSVRDGVQAQAALHLVFVGAPSENDLAWHLRSRIVLGAGARLAIVEHHLASGSHRHLINAVLDVDLAAGAELCHVRVQDEDTGASLFQRSTITVGDNAHYRRLDLELGAALSRHELNIDLAGVAAAARAHGVLLADGKRHVDTRLGVVHSARDTHSELTWRGLGAASGRAVFHGGIVIRAGADGSDATLSNKNLLLSAEAEIDTQPVLEIHADEVKAAHGATVGQLDPSALFYLRSRGLPADEARRLLTIAFCREPISAVVDSALAATLSAALDRRLHASGAL